MACIYRTSGEYPDDIGDFPQIMSQRAMLFAASLQKGKNPSIFSLAKKKTVPTYVLNDAHKHLLIPSRMMEVDPQRVFSECEDSFSDHQCGSRADPVIPKKSVSFPHEEAKTPGSPVASGLSKLLLRTSSSDDLPPRSSQPAPPLDPLRPSLPVGVALAPPAEKKKKTFAKPTIDQASATPAQGRSKRKILWEEEKAKADAALQKKKAAISAEREKKKNAVAADREKQKAAQGLRPEAARPRKLSPTQVGEMQANDSSPAPPSASVQEASSLLPPPNTAPSPAAATPPPISDKSGADASEKAEELAKLQQREEAKAVVSKDITSQ